jgi:phage gp29-like protein
MREFSARMLAGGQEEIDRAVESYVDALGTAKSYEAAAGALEKAYKRRDAGAFARLIDEVRYAAAGIGGAKRRGNRGD